MYHYVRDLEHSRFPEIKGLSTDQFREQVVYIKKHYNVISGDDLLDTVDSGEDLPPRALLLTFDDGYIDHFTQVFPILDQEKTSGCFFPPAKCILENRVLDVNKIHFILASVPNKADIVNYIFRMLDEYGSHFQIQDKDYYWNRLATGNRFDPKEVIFIKRILQRELPEELRSSIIDALFKKYVNSDEGSFSRELYLSIDQITCLRRHGMYIGSHGYNHYWLNTLDQAAQKREVDLSLEFLNRIGSRLDSWIMCYPYGAYDDSLLSILSSRGCKVGLTTEVGIANFHRDNLLALPRLDTNDLPKRANAIPNQWTLQAMK
jgi:peptidoglycan/xylan/chitin deacetylase (PgdA/CDA1 family)